MRFTTTTFLYPTVFVVFSIGCHGLWTKSLRNNHVNFFIVSKILLHSKSKLYMKNLIELFALLLSCVLQRSLCMVCVFENRTVAVRLRYNSCRSKYMTKILCSFKTFRITKVVNHSLASLSSSFWGVFVIVLQNIVNAHLRVMKEMYSWQKETSTEGISVCWTQIYLLYDYHHYVSEQNWREVMAEKQERDYPSRIFAFKAFEGLKREGW